MTGPSSETPERTFGAARRALDAAQKPGGGVPAYTRWINRRLARGVAAGAYALGLSANTVTILSAALSAAGIAVLLAVPQPVIATGLAVGLLLAAGYVFDSADGQVARLSRSGGPAGEWFDHVVDAIRTPAIHLAVLVGLSRQGQPDWVLALPILYVLVSVGLFMSQILAEQLSRRAGGPSGITETGGVAKSVLLLPTDMGALCLIFLTWGAPAVFLVLYTAMLLANGVHTVVSMVRKHRRLSALAPTPAPAPAGAASAADASTPSPERTPA